MILFCWAIDLIVKQLGAKYRVIVYADDLAIAHSKEIDPSIIIKEASDAFTKLGLEVNLQKCHSTQK